MKRCLHALYQRSYPSTSPTILLRPFAIPLDPVASTSGFQCRFYTSVSATELQFGQPVYETHPHLLKAGELTPGITAIEYAQRRSRLAAKLPKNAIAVVAASDVKYRSGTVFYDFHQDSNFFYLTGFNEPQAVAVIGKAAEENDHEFHLFVRPKDSKAEQWDGARSGLQAALDVFNADETGDINNAQTLLSQIVSAASEVYTDLGPKPTTGSAFSRFFSSPSSKSEGFAEILKTSKVQPLKPIIDDLRLLKSDAEVANMRKAGQISGRVFTEIMRHAWTHEKDLAAFLDYRFKTQGCEASAYIPVVAGGENARMIHYVRNDSTLPPNSLILVDAGAQHGNYITDITRTFPTSPRFTPAQRDLYTAVLTTQRTCISLCRASSNISLDKLHTIAEASLKDQLAQLGFDTSGNAMEILFPHHLSHYIGLDVHDTPGMSRKQPLRERMCVTVEPGVYVPHDDGRFPERFRGMGIRIEDSVCVQEEHPFVLTTEAVKEVVDIEALRG